LLLSGTSQDEADRKISARNNLETRSLKKILWTIFKIFLWIEAWCLLWLLVLWATGGLPWDRPATPEELRTRRCIKSSASTCLKSPASQAPK
jgi:hypothetical protein